MLERIIHLLVANIGPLVAAALLPLVLGTLFALAAQLSVVWLALRRGWWRGAAGITAAVVLGVLALPSAAGVGLACAAGPLAEEAARVVGREREALGLSAPVGLALLLPLVDAWTANGGDDEAFFALETADHSIDLAAFATPAGQKALLGRLTEAHIRARYERHAHATVVRFTARGRAGRLLAQAIDGELTALVDAYPALVAALHTDSKGHLPPTEASAQLAASFFEGWGPLRARRLAEGERVWGFMLALGPWWLAAAVATLVGRLSQRRVSL